MKSFFHEKLYAHNTESFSNQANNDIPFSMTIKVFNPFIVVTDILIPLALLNDRYTHAVSLSSQILKSIYALWSVPEVDSYLSILLYSTTSIYT